MSQSPISQIFTSASDLPNDFWAIALANQAHFNTILPAAQKCLADERAGKRVQGQYWIIVFSHSPHPTIELVLSCTNTEMGAYPIFIASAIPIRRVTDRFLRPRVTLLAKALFERVPRATKRTYSVFAPDAIVNIFSPIWSALTGVSSYEQAYYAAKLSICTRRTFVNRSTTVINGVEMELRPATTSDVQSVAELCYGFAAESEPFTLTHQKAFQEASLLIQKREVWVHTIRDGTGATGIASIVAFTRNSDALATITKVYTNPTWRRRGCAERLVRSVCRHLLTSKEQVALYVAHNNPGASKVYHRVGFAGLGAGASEGVNFESWTEIGFDRSVVELGHW